MMFYCYKNLKREQLSYHTVITASKSLRIVNMDYFNDVSVISESEGTTTYSLLLFSIDNNEKTFKKIIQCIDITVY